MSASDEHGPATPVADEFIRRLAGRDRRAAVDALYRAHAARVLSNLYLMLRNAEIARDLTQETFVRAFTAESLFASDAPLRAWLLKVASRLALNHVRETRRRAVREERHAPVPAGRPDPLDDVLSRHLNQELAVGMRTLPLPYRQALVLRYHEGLSCDDIGRVMDLPSGTVMSHLYRARLVLKRRLETDGAGARDARPERRGSR